MVDTMANRDVWTETDADSPYSEASLARLDVSAQARELATFARGLVGIGDRADRDLDVLVEDAARLRAQADLVLTRAVVAARAAGASWEAIGAGLGVSRQEAHRRYRDAEQTWFDDLARPEGELADGTRYWKASTAVREPDAVAADLDAWLAASREPGQVDMPVAAALVRLGPVEEASHLIARRRALMNANEQPPADQLAAIYERESIVFERLAASGKQPAYYREVAAQSRARAAELRAQLGESDGGQQ
jgi:hypothetical protein